MNHEKIQRYLFAQRLKMAVYILVMLICQCCTWQILVHYYMKAGSAWLVGVTIFLAAALVFGILRLLDFLLQKLAVRSREKWQQSFETISTTTEQLCRRTGRPLPTIGLWKGVSFDGAVKSTLLARGTEDKTLAKLMQYNAGMVDLPFRQDVMFVGEKLPEILTPAELEAVIAHELRHSDQLENKAIYLLMFCGCAISALCYVGGIHFLFANGWRSPETWILLFAAPTLTRICGGLIKLTLAAFSRTREIETDVESCRDTQNVESLISALDKIKTAMEAEASVAAPSWPFHSHPSNKKRAKALRALVA
jgi:Zn-dependent protease with chaperone function